MQKWLSQLTRHSTRELMEPCIPLGSLNRVPALIGWGKGGNVTSAGWQVTLCDPIWHVSSCSGVVFVAQTAVRFFTFFYLYRGVTWWIQLNEHSWKSYGNLQNLLEIFWLSLCVCYYVIQL